MSKLAIIVICICLFLGHDYAIAQGSEPPEFRGPDKEIEKPSSQEKKLYSEVVDAMGLVPKSDEKPDANKIQEAISRLNKIIESNPEYSDAYIIRAMLRFHFQGSKDYQRIIDDIDNAIRVYPLKLKSAYESNAPKYSLRAKAYKDMGNYRQAIEDLERAVNLGPNDVINSGEVNPDKPSPPGIWGRNDFDDIIKRFPDEFRGYMFRGLYYAFFTRFGAKTHSLAIKDYRRAINLNPKSAMCHFLLGEILYSYKLGFLGTAKSEEDYAREVKADMAGLPRRTVYPEEYKTTIEAYTKAIQLDPKMLRAYHMRAHVYSYLGKEYELAIKNYDKIIELEPDSGAYHDRALAYMHLGKYGTAVDDFTKALEARKGKADYFYYENRAGAYIKLGDYEKAIKDIDKAVEMNLEAFTILGNVSQFRVAYPEYNDYSDEFLAKKLHRKFHPNLQYEDFAKMFLRENKGFFGSIVPELYVKRGDAYLNLGYYKKAVQEYNRIKAFSDFAKYFDEWQRWRRVGENASGDEYYVDSRTVAYPQKDSVRFWVKTVYGKPGKSGISYSQQNLEVNKISRMIKTISSDSYDSDGNVLRSTGTGGWHTIVPDSIGEKFYEGWFREIK